MQKPYYNNLRVVLLCCIYHDVLLNIISFNLRSRGVKNHGKEDCKEEGREEKNG